MSVSQVSTLLSHNPGGLA